MSRPSSSARRVLALAALGSLLAACGADSRPAPDLDLYGDGDGDADLDDELEVTPEVNGPDAPFCLEGDGPAIDSPDLTATLNTLLEANPIAGLAIGLARGDELVFLDGLGEADPHTGLPATADTPFPLASVTKVVVATLALRLVDEGLLELDVDVGAQAPILSSVRNPAFPDVPITPRMLLTHTSTLWDLPFTYDSTWVTSGDAPLPMRDFVVGYFDESSPWSGGDAMWWTDAPPGFFSCYSNMAFGVLGVLLEEVSGASLEDLLRTRIFDPLGMTNTSLRIEAYCEGRLIARGVRPVGASRREGFVDDDLGGDDGPGQPEGHPELASGMLKSSARDLLRFTLAIANGGAWDGVQVLSPTSTALLLSRQLAPTLATCGDGRSDPGEQALGFTHLPEGTDADGVDVDWTGHYGGMAGFSAALWFDPSPDGLRYVILQNQLDLAALYAVELALLSAPR